MIPPVSGMVNLTFVYARNKKNVSANLPRAHAIDFFDSNSDLSHNLLQGPLPDLSRLSPVIQTMSVDPIVTPDHIARF